MKRMVVVALPLMLGACGGPVEVTVAKLASDLISYVTTGKSTTDHAVSMVAEKDCALHRPLLDEDICRENAPVDAVALADRGAPDIKQELRHSDPAIFAVNGRAEDWSNPFGQTPPASSAAQRSADVMTAAMPPRHPDGGADAHAQIGATAQDNGERPAIYAVNAQYAQNAAQKAAKNAVPNASGEKTAASAKAGKPVDMAKAAKGKAHGNDIMVASTDANMKFGRAARLAESREQDGVIEAAALDPQGEADMAIAGYVHEPAPAPARPQTRTASLGNDVMIDATMAEPVAGGANGTADAAVAHVSAADLGLLPGDYVVLASFTDEDRAQNALVIYGEYQPRLIPAIVNGKQYMRVAVGPLSHEHARDLRHLAAKKGIKDSWIVGVDAAGE